jgi:predicted nucleotidyltransferase
MAASLEKIFPSRAFVDVLLFFLLHPQEETYLARIVRATGKVLIQVQRVLKRLEESGLIRKIWRGNKSYYQANATHPAFKDLKQLLIKTVVLSDNLEKEYSQIREKIHFGFIFGSTAKNADTSLSDIDLFLIGTLTLEEAGYLSYPLSVELGREVNTVVCTIKDFKAKIKQQHTFIREVIHNPKIWLFGDEHEFEKICR